MLWDSNHPCSSDKGEQNNEHLYPRLDVMVGLIKGRKKNANKINQYPAMSNNTSECSLTINKTIRLLWNQYEADTFV